MTPTNTDELREGSRVAWTFPDGSSTTGDWKIHHIFDLNDTTCAVLVGVDEPGVSDVLVKAVSELKAK